MNRTTRLVGLTTLIIALSLTGCSDSNPDDQPSASSPSASTTTDVSAPGATASASPRPIDTLVQTGIEQAQSGDLTSATTTFNNALVLDPQNKYALYNLGLVAQTADDVVTAGRYYNEALAIDPQYTPALYNKAISIETTAPDKAVDLYTKILRIDPKAATTYLRLGFVYAAQGKNDEAARARAQAVDLDPTLASVTAP